MLTKRLIACFDIINGMVTKAVRFQDNIHVAPAKELAGTMYEEQIGRKSGFRKWGGTG